MNKTLFVLGVAIIAILVGYKELATGLVLVAGLMIVLADQRKTQAIQSLSTELEARNDVISYPFLVKTAMDWAKSGKSYQIPPDQDKKAPLWLYVGHTVVGALDGKPIFLPELEVTETYIDRTSLLD